MPHMELRLSRNLVERIDLAALVTDLSDEMAACGIFPLGGIRVRAIVCDPCAIGDRHPDNAFLDMQLRIGAGRTEEAIRTAGDRLFAFVKARLGEELAAPHFMLSFDIQEIDPRFSWKENSIHARLRAEGDRQT